LRLLNLGIKSEIAEFISEVLYIFINQGIINNSTLKTLIINNCILNNEAYEILIKGVLTHKTLEFLDLSNNQLSDKSGNMVGRIISRQSQRRDQIVWMYGLRNEKPSNNDYAKGLVEINLSSNNLSDISADDIASALAYDVYLRVFL
jgi:Leucine-rich repeat (LRR) protein